MTEVARARGPFTDRVVAITGGAGDIGLATARHLGRLGATIALIDLDGDKLATAEATLTADGVPVHTWPCDVTDEATVDATAAAIVDRYGRVQHLFNNAGILGPFRPLLDYPIDDFDAILAVNVRGAFLVLRAFARHMASQGGGSIVDRASMAATGGPSAGPPPRGRPRRRQRPDLGRHPVGPRSAGAARGPPLRRAACAAATGSRPDGRRRPDRTPARFLAGRRLRR